MGLWRLKVLDTLLVLQIRFSASGFFFFFKAPVAYSFVCETKKAFLWHQAVKPLSFGSVISDSVSIPEVLVVRINFRICLECV